MLEYIAAACAALSLAVSAAVLVTVRRLAARQSTDEARRGLIDMERRLTEQQERQSQLVDQWFARFSAGTDGKLDALRTVTEQRLEGLRQQTRQDLEAIRLTTERKLAEMRGVVDETLQKTLEERISRSFQAVSQNLEQVYKSLGEMQAMAADVGDLKKVLSGVKTRGMLGEYQLGALLEQLLSPEQYVVNTATDGPDAAGTERVEYAIKMPGGTPSADGGDGRPVLLPVDSKFPLDRYSALCEAYESGDKAAVDAAARELRGALLASAKAVTKYIHPPETTEFAILFLPFEGLYAEVIRLGLLEELSQKYRVNITGPSTMGAFLNSLQMGFRTLRIQKSSGEVWAVLAKARKEFETFTQSLEKAQRSLNSTSEELERLVGVRSRGILRSLKSVETDNLLPEPLQSDDG
ncbi:MAG: DNA recombination protein RmuC [Oscillospiraceae bacterium]|nr:DNA recombination protein RmuC [Oscillospiraceae bacterium]